jgi:hypothetical protein
MKKLIIAICLYGCQLAYTQNTVSNPHLDVQGPLYLRENINILNKAANGWIPWAIRNTSLTETTLDLQNINNAFFSGKVGIGTPVALPWEQSKGLFEVRNGSLLGSAAGSNRLLTCTSQASGTNYFQNNVWALRDSSGGNDWLSTRLHDGISIDVSFLTPGVDTRTWWERAPFKDIQSFGSGKTAYLTINSGNVGIGTTSPTARLQVETGSDSSPALRLQSGGFSMNGTAPFSIDANGVFSGRFIVLGNGNVGIGTPLPDSKLSVNGTIHTKEVKVDLTNWPDYVFEPTYDLKPLKEIESYIKANKHLPEVPSAKEMETNGVQLGEMNMLLLKKVEELTLYVIELKKRDEAQQKEIEELKN